MSRVDRAAVSIAVVALALWIGGIVALGACAAPLVFRIVPAPWSGDAMGAAFRRFDAIAIGCAVVVLACEAMLLRVRRAKITGLDRLRSVAALGAAAAALYGGLVLSPGIVALHAAGAVRGLGDDGAALERLHRIAEAVAKVEVVLGLLLLVVHVVSARPDPGSAKAT